MLSSNSTDIPPGDISSYRSQFGINPGPALKNVLLDGVNGAAGANTDEVCLDIELMIALAPSASEIIVYEVSSPLSALTQIADDNTAKSISTSWGINEANAESDP